MKRSSIVLTAAVFAFALGGCAPTPPQPVALPTVTATPSASPSATTAPLGSRSNPVPAGQALSLATGSAWTVGASAETSVFPEFAVLPLSISIDWDNSRAQAAELGEDVDSSGLNPDMSLRVEFVTAAGKTYGDASVPFDAEGYNYETELYQVGAVYPPTESITATYSLLVPAAEVPGGSWKVSNLNGDIIFLSSGK